MQPTQSLKVARLTILITILSLPHTTDSWQICDTFQAQPTISKSWPRAETGRIPPPSSVRPSHRTFMTGLFSISTVQEEHRNNASTMMQQGDSEDHDEAYSLYSDHIWNSYKSAMEEMITRPRVVKKTKAHEIERCSKYLLSMTPTISRDDSGDVSSDFLKSKESFQQILQDQSATFQQQHNFTKQEHEFITRCLVYIGDACAKVRSTESEDDNPSFRRQAPIIVAWNKFKEMGWMPRENAFSTYMYILGSRDGDKDAHENPIQSLCDDALIEVVTCHGWLYGRNEKTIAIQLKNLIERGKVEEAEELLLALGREAAESAAANQSGGNKMDTRGRELGLKLRTFLPLFTYYCKEGNVKAVLKLYDRMRKAPGVLFDVETHSLLLSSLASHGYFQPGSEYGPDLFEQLVSNMAADVLELTPKTVEEIENGFRHGCTTNNATSETSFGLVKIPSNRTCPASGTELRLISLDESQRRHVHDTLLVMAKLARKEFTARVENRQAKKNKNKELPPVTTTKEGLPEEDPAYQALLNFSHWLDSREGDPYTAIVDGANVAYYGHSNVHYSSLKLVVEKLQEMGERPLVVMPSKYTQPKFFTSGPKTMQFLSKPDLAVIEWLEANDMIYIVPRLSLDDYFWMLASVSNQDTSRKGADLSVPLDDKSGRFPGMRPMIITDDQMRDHRLELLEPREFRRWCSCHIVNYHIGPYENDEWKEEREILLEPADYFSREIQGNPHPNGKGNVWHFPISNSSDWFFIWLER